MLIIMMMMMPRKTMAHIKTDPAAPSTDAAQRAKNSENVHKPPHQTIAVAMVKEAKNEVKQKDYLVSK